MAIPSNIPNPVPSPSQMQQQVEKKGVTQEPSKEQAPKIHESILDKEVRELGEKLAQKNAILPPKEKVEDLLKDINRTLVQTNKSIIKLEKELEVSSKYIQQVNALKAEISSIKQASMKLQEEARDEEQVAKGILDIPKEIFIDAKQAKKITPLKNEAEELEKLAKINEDLAKGFELLAGPINEETIEIIQEVTEDKIQETKGIIKQLNLILNGLKKRGSPEEMIKKLVSKIDNYEHFLKAYDVIQKVSSGDLTEKSKTASSEIGKTFTKTAQEQMHSSILAKNTAAALTKEAVENPLVTQKYDEYRQSAVGHRALSNVLKKEARQKLDTVTAKTAALAKLIEKENKFFDKIDQKEVLANLKEHLENQRETCIRALEKIKAQPTSGRASPLLPQELKALENTRQQSASPPKLDQDT